ncbi:MAG: biopolymer transporter ExbD [candidate division WOR-3 bacterium]|jgi:biopolymer transport protein ExbD|nr:biopolymer transporter ExbD [candidate division WOR-3 bacterium]MCR4423381.1 biopolymer transporter ExbD [candidate division WOR-3 bacterium]MDH7518720.1 biopolymer transporter ExbD [bacterium]
MALSLRPRTKGSSEPNIPTASTGDIAFLILIFFMSTSIFSREKGLKIVLPEKGAETKIKAENILTVAVNQTGQVLIGDRIVNVPEVHTLVREELDKNPELAVALRVSRSAPYQIMVEVFDQLKIAKAERISLVPVQEEGGGQ